MPTTEVHHRIRHHVGAGPVAVDRGMAAISNYDDVVIGIGSSVWIVGIRHHEGTAPESVEVTADKHDVILEVPLTISFIGG